MNCARVPPSSPGWSKSSAVRCSGTRNPGKAAEQLRDASSAVAANHRAAGCARSHKEFTAKIGTVREEADESRFWLEHLLACKLSSADPVEPLLQEALELVAIFSKSFATAKAKDERDERLRRSRRGKRT